MEGKYAFLYPSLEEITEPECAKITGEIPDFLHGGSVIRAGPGKFDFEQENKEKFTVNHFLDGYAMLTRFQITKDHVKYDRKFLKTDAYTKAMACGRTIISEFGTPGQKLDPTKSFFTRYIPSLIPEISDNCNVSLFKIGHDFFAAADTCFFRKIDPVSLQCVDCPKFDTRQLFSLNLWSCHPMQCDDGFIYNVGTSCITGLKYNIVKIPVPTAGQTAKDVLKKAKILTTIPSSHTFCASACHSYGMTERYIIFIEQPMVIVAQKVLAATCSILHKSCNRDFMEYRPEIKNRFSVIEKSSGKVIKTEFISAESFFFLHIINCYEDDNEIVVDLCAFPNAGVIDLSLKDFRNGNEGPLEGLAEGRRYVIPLTGNNNDPPELTNLVKKVRTTATAIKEKKAIILTYETLTKKGIEVPIVHPDFCGKRYKHFFGGGAREVGPYKSAICKFNVDNKETQCFRLNEGEFLGEPIFIPDPQDKSGDDCGILVSCLTRTTAPGEKCGLVFINARTMTMIAKAEFNNFVPLSIHGIFITKDELENSNS